MSVVYLGETQMTVTEVVGSGHVRPIIWPVAKDPDSGAMVLLEHRFQLCHPETGVLKEGWWFGFCGDDVVYCGPRAIPPSPLSKIVNDLQRQISEET
jgi:hypothetical protein